MNIVEKEAKKFSRIFCHSHQINSLENLKSSLSKELYNFSRDRDKLDLLLVYNKQGK